MYRNSTKYVDIECVVPKKNQFTSISITVRFSIYITISLQWLDECKPSAYMLYTLHNISKVSEWRFRISVCGLFSVIVITYRYGSAVSLDNTYIHLHAVTRLVGTNCPRKWRFDLSESTAKFDNRTLHHNTPYPSVTVTVDIKFTSVLPP